MKEQLYMGEAIANVRGGRWTYIKNVKRRSGYTYRRYKSEKGEEVDAYFSDTGLALESPEPDEMDEDRLISELQDLYDKMEEN